LHKGDFLFIIGCMSEYNHLKIEKKWQKEWEKKGIYYAKNNSKNPKFYGLIEFPYPSGAGMHAGHVRSNTAMDVISRKRRMEGYNVLYPIGWDAFGLPTENYAIKTGIHPIKVTKDNTDTFRRQLKSLGFSFDWSREINTTDPKYYKWTQWIFLQFFKKGLAYKKRTQINWCPSCKIGLANEEVVDGRCERCGGLTEKREKEQWMLAITKYADRLDKDLDTVDYLEKIKIQQRNWIGKSEGVNFKCKVKDLGIAVEMYNSVPQTFRAETFTVIAPEHHLISKLISNTEYEKPVLDFIKKLNQKRTRKDFNADKEMEGIFTGRYIENFAGSGRDLPIWIASYVVADYGTGIVNASAHDTRDFAFAKKYNIPLRNVAEPLFVKTDGVDAFRKDEPVVERNAVVCIIKHWSEDKYLCLDWKKVPWKGFVIGGIEDNEKLEDTAIREIREETGYKNARFVKSFPKIHSKFYQPVKKVNRFAHFHPVYIELMNGDKEEILQAEKDIHDVVWVPKDEVKFFLNVEDLKWIWENFQGIEKPVVKNGILNEPAEFKGREWGEVRNDIINYIIKNGWGEKKVNFKLRDWIFSRQRYWGEPIPLIYCSHCAKASQGKDNAGWVPVSEKDLPVKLPNIKNYQPTNSGESPLANILKWVNVKCPKCKGKAKRETDTMPNWAGSSWYYLRYVDPKNNKEFASEKSLKYWLGSDPRHGGVDWYNGGMEHTTLHLLYSRFWHKFLYDLKLVPTSEPYMKRTSQGMILADDGTKFSKSKGNGVNPEDVVKTYGADSFRLYEMFMGPFDQSVSWSKDGMVGPRRFIEKVWRIGEKVIKIGSPKKNSPAFALGDRGQGTHGSLNSSSESLQKLLNKTIKKVSEDIEEMRFNTAISSMMILATEMEKAEYVSAQDFKMFLQILSPFAPHVAEELWSMLGEKKSINLSTWPKWDENLIKDEEIKIVVQINGKIRSEIMIQIESSEEDVKKKVIMDENILKYTTGKEIKRFIYIKNRLVNIVI
jgi:leucyl-tRNA synthetase